MQIKMDGISVSTVSITTMDHGTDLPSVAGI
jgi:hypothetical protein